VYCTRSGSSLVVFWGVAQGNRDPSDRSTVILPLTPLDTLHTTLSLPRLLGDNINTIRLCSLQRPAAVQIRTPPVASALSLMAATTRSSFRASTRSACSSDVSQESKCIDSGVQSLSIRFGVWLSMLSPTSAAPMHLPRNRDVVSHSTPERCSAIALAGLMWQGNGPQAQHLLRTTTHWLMSLSDALSSCQQAILHVCL
jgi:hypothetical protein